MRRLGRSWPTRSPPLSTAALELPSQIVSRSKRVGLGQLFVGDVGGLAVGREERIVGVAQPCRLSVVQVGESALLQHGFEGALRVQRVACSSSRLRASSETSARSSSEGPGSGLYQISAKPLPPVFSTPFSKA